MAWEVEVTDRFVEWFDGLTPAQRRALTAAIDLLEHRGPGLGRPLMDMRGAKLPNLKELRVSEGGALRVLFVFDPRRTTILLLGGDKTGRWSEWYAAAIPEAERLYAEYLAELRREGLL